MGARYTGLDLNKAPWNDVRAALANIDWSEIKTLSESSTEDALTCYHETILCVHEKLVPTKVEKKFKAKSKMNRMRCLLWKRHAKAKQKLREGSTIHLVYRALQRV